MNVFEQLEYDGVIPVVSPAVGADVHMLADAFLAGGLSCVEVVLDDERAFDAVRTLAQRGDLVVGAGWVLSVEMARAAVTAGASYLACPGLNIKLVQFCQQQGIPVLPGISNPTELHMAHDLGLEIVKFFPAEVSGGTAMLDVMARPYRNMRFIPEGGIEPANLMSYLEHDQVIACSADWVAEPRLYMDEQYARVTTLVREAVRLTAKWETCPDSRGPLLIRYRVSQPNGAALVQNGLNHALTT